MKQKEPRFFKGEEIVLGDVLFYIGRGRVELWRVRGVGRNRIVFDGASIRWPCFRQEYESRLFWTARDAKEALSKT